VFWSSTVPIHVPDARSKHPITVTSRTEDMATLSLAGLQALVEDLGLDVPIPVFAGADVLNNPLDIARSYVAEIVCNGLPTCDPQLAYNAISSPNNLDAGDLAITVQKACQGVKPDEAVDRIMEQVSRSRVAS